MPMPTSMLESPMMPQMVESMMVAMIESMMVAVMVESMIESTTVAMIESTTVAMIESMTMPMMVHGSAAPRIGASARAIGLARLPPTRWARINT
jgi:hypothetical protein